MVMSRITNVNDKQLWGVGASSKCRFDLRENRRFQPEAEKPIPAKSPQRSCSRALPKRPPYSTNGAFPTPKHHLSFCTDGGIYRSMSVQTTKSTSVHGLRWAYAPELAVEAVSDKEEGTVYQTVPFFPRNVQLTWNLTAL